MHENVLIAKKPPLFFVTLNRPAARNAVDGPTARALCEAFRAFEADEASSVAILTGAGESFCAGADLKAVSSGDAERVNDLTPPTGEALEPGPMGPTRMRLGKPVLAAVSGYCVAGGLELALWCDLRVADETAVFGVFCRRFGVPLIDGGTFRLPRAIGMSRALDLILTGRPVDAREALEIGLVNRLVPRASLLEETERLALAIAAFPQACLRGDRMSAYEQWAMSPADALANELSHGLRTLASGETFSGASRFAEGAGRGGKVGP